MHSDAESVDESLQIGDNSQRKFSSAMTTLKMTNQKCEIIKSTTVTIIDKNETTKTNYVCRNLSTSYAVYNCFTYTSLYS